MTYVFASIFFLLYFYFYTLHAGEPTRYECVSKGVYGFTTFSGQCLKALWCLLDPPSAIAGLGAAYVRDARLQNLDDERKALERRGRSGISAGPGMHVEPPREPPDAYAMHPRCPWRRGGVLGEGQARAPPRAKQVRGGPWRGGAFGRAVGRRAAEGRAAAAGPVQDEAQTCVAELSMVCYTRLGF